MIPTDPMMALIYISDIVDHERADGNVWKMLLGSTNDTFDHVNENEVGNENRHSFMSNTTARSQSMTDKEF
jgi:hypothetical protein